MAREIAFAVVVLIWPLGAWLEVTVRSVPRSEAWRSFARATALAGVLAVVVIGLGVWAGVTNGTTGGMWAAAAMLWGVLAHTPADPGPSPEEEAPNTSSDVLDAPRVPEARAPTDGVSDL